MMAADPNLIRASDQDRDRTANVLREHHAVGRFDAEEFNERLDQAFSAKTMGELEALTADLPAVDPYPLPTSSLPRQYAAAGGGLPASSVIGAMARNLAAAHRYLADDRGRVPVATVGDRAVGRGHGGPVDRGLAS